MGKWEIIGVLVGAAAETIAVFIASLFRRRSGPQWPPYGQLPAVPLGSNKATLQNVREALKKEDESDG